MAQNPGTRLGVYEVLSPLGAGGMGEVYRAKDTKLDRDVAIKVLPAAFTEDRERLARFEREAKLLASLNHPNIAHVYGFESARLEDGATAHFLAMELVEGDDLSERLRRGAIPVEEALAIAKQIAEALEEAHDKGIVHRDLKPANVKLTPDGKVKVLDFGLAKAYAAESSSGDSVDLSQSPTLAQAGTQVGVILGTAAYMSPEQARGKAMDKRSDIWSFGVVLYEMLTARKLFTGETVGDVLASVLKSEIDLASLPDSAPSAIRQMLRRCLERNPRNRLHDIADARIVIDEVLAGGVEEAQPDARVERPSMQRLIAAALLLAGLGALGGFLARGPTDLGDRAPTFTLRRLTQLPGMEGHPDISPDGRQFIYTSEVSGNLDIYSMRVGGSRAINLTASSPAADSQPAFSPDGEMLAFRSERDGGGLFVMGATGESVRRLTDDGFDPAWSPDGTRVAYSMEPVFDPYSRILDAGLWIVDVTSGEKHQRLPGDAVQPAWSPDGRFIAYWANTEGQRDLWTVAVEGGAPVALTADLATDWSPEWSPDSRWIYFSSDRAGGMNLFRVAV
ncbi:MAG TPA: protein kinase, partial [Vicinamibacteria bacterium]|nr:protein kinase [Vicinamibacteria bacterium]